MSAKRKKFDGAFFLNSIFKGVNLKKESMYRKFILLYLSVYNDSSRNPFNYTHFIRKCNKKHIQNMTYQMDLIPDKWVGSVREKFRRFMGSLIKIDSLIGKLYKHVE